MAHVSNVPIITRHPLNKDLRITHDSSFYINTPELVRKFNIINSYGGVVLNDLETFYSVLKQAFTAHHRVMAFRVDLHFPVEWPDSFIPGNEVMTRFFKSLNKRVELKTRNTDHRTRARYIWVREEGNYQERVHYHLVILVNACAYRTLGVTDHVIDTLWGGIVRSWTTALQLFDPESQKYLVHVPDKAVYIVYRNDLYVHSGIPVVFDTEYWKKKNSSNDNAWGCSCIDELFYRVSYMFKVDTKIIVKNIHRIGASTV